MSLLRGAVYWCMVVIMAFSVHTHPRSVLVHVSEQSRYHSHMQSYKGTSIRFCSGQFKVEF